MANKHPKINGCFKKSPQGLDEKKSNGQIERSKEVNCLRRIRSLWGASTIDTKLIDGIDEEVQNGRYDNAIKLLNIIKENETQNINMMGEVQKIFVNKKDENKVNKHIDDIINS